LTTLDEAGKLADDADNKEGLAEGCMYRCGIYTAAGDFDEAYRYLERAARIGGELDAEEPLLYGKTHIANTMIFMTEYDKAWPRIEDALSHARARGNLKYVAELKSLALPSYLLRNGEVDAAVDAARESVTLAARIGSVASECQGLVFEGQVATMQGKYERAIACNEAAVEAARLSGIPYLQGFALCTLGTSYLQVSANLRAKAGAVHEETLRTLDAPMGEAMAATNLCEVGYCALDLGKDEEAGELFSRAIDSRSATMFLIRPRVLLGAATVALNRGDTDSAENYVASADEFVEERSMAHMRPFVALTRGDIKAQMGAREEALQAYDNSIELARALHFLPTVWRAHAGAAAVHSASGDKRKAENRRESAAETIREIAARFEDSDLGERFAEESLAEL